MESLGGISGHYLLSPSAVSFIKFPENTPCDFVFLTCDSVDMTAGEPCVEEA